MTDRGAFTFFISGFMNEAELKNSVNIQSSTLGRLLLSAGMKPGSGRAPDIFMQA